MRSALEDFYLQSPIPVQNILINIKGLFVRNNRNAGNYSTYLRTVLGRARWTQEEFLDFQFSEAKRIINVAAQTVPYYRSRFAETGFDPMDFKCLDDLKRLPLLSKDPLRERPLDFVNESVPQAKLSVFHTTGSTGTPLNIYANNDVRRWNYAFFDAYQIGLGVNPRRRRATLGGRLICHPNQKRPPFWRYVYAQKNMLFSSYHLTAANMPYYVKKLSEYQPEVIDSYPSSIFTIGKYMLDTGRKGLIKPKAIITSAATLFDEQREVIEEAFDCKVSDQYGAAEMCVFAGQCREGNYHYRPDYGIVEVLKDNEAAKLGEVGEITCTGLINHVMPLIRYRIGDLAILGQGQCRCGLNSPFFNRIIGRIDDVIVTPDGRFVGRLSPVLKGFPVKEAQYIQDSIDRVVVKIVKDNGYAEDTSKEIVKEIRKRLGERILITLDFVDQIERGPGGKLRTVISEVSRKVRLDDFHACN